ncbi:hypothetical protein P280DRAFT_502698 [Massarina eburnea CBS 473.64]|uniref:Uncharacterized protein n=1 Tax=Massarina eburnea CBS 473.64 TaxID=1395130 RepID=A0A6A6SIG8_9PLEO|nr:hypothetical protein P280DRAFT_502698 [Massarina eburnea CBS 473.64]
MGFLFFSFISSSCGGGGGGGGGPPGGGGGASGACCGSGMGGPIQSTSLGSQKATQSGANRRRSHAAWTTRGPARMGGEVNIGTVEMETEEREKEKEEEKENFWRGGFQELGSAAAAAAAAAAGAGAAGQAAVAGAGLTPPALGGGDGDGSTFLPNRESGWSAGSRRFFCSHEC